MCDDSEMAKTTPLIPSERIESKILLVRNVKVMLDADLADLYGVTTKVLNQAVRRKRDRFPRDFMFQLTKEEFEILRSQPATSSRWGGRRYCPYAFTEQGVAMLSSVLNSPRAIRVNIEIMRAFVRMRRMLFTHEMLAGKLAALERKAASHDESIRSIVAAIRQLMDPTEPPKRRQIGFQVKDDEKRR